MIRGNRARINMVDDIWYGISNEEDSIDELIDDLNEAKERLHCEEDECERAMLIKDIVYFEQELQLHKERCEELYKMLSSFNSVDDSY